MEEGPSWTGPAWLTDGRRGHRKEGEKYEGEKERSEKPNPNYGIYMEPSEMGFWAWFGPHDFRRRAL